MTDTNAKPDPSELEPYLRAGWQLIPLHRWDHMDNHKGRSRQRGKSPLHGNWTRRPYKSKEQIAHMEGGGNVGVRLRAKDLVIDVDPRNMPEGRDTFTELCVDVGLDPDDFPCVRTGSGGLHLYMTKPSDVSVRDSLEAYEGVEFKTLGRQVVSAGSLHPTTINTYTWEFLGPDLGQAPPAPSRLMNLIRRPSRALATGGGEHDQEEVAAMLDALDPGDFRDHEGWLTLMMACHHASAGDARSEFVEWSTRDPDFRDEGIAIGRRWDSLHSGEGDGGRVTYRTLHKILCDNGQEAAIPRTPASDDFEAIGPEDVAPMEGESGEPVEEHEKKGPLERMNDKYWAVMQGSKFRVMYEQTDPALNRKHWISVSPHDFKHMLANRRVQKGERTVPVADAWMEWGGRRTAEGVVFDPERDHPGWLNLWTGWGVEPAKGDWSLMEDLIWDVLCDKDEDVHKYVLDWMAHLFQHPGTPAETAVCFQGGMGTGKGTLGRALATLAGRHGMQVTSSEHITGRFNSHLRDVVLLFADEAIAPHDRDAVSRLKALITEPTLAYEAKGVDLTTDANRIHVIMASNEDWFVPMSLDGERRFLLQRVSNRRQGDHSFFAQLNKQLDEGGMQAMLFDLLNRDLGKYKPRLSIPATQASIEQKVRNLHPIQSWWFEALTEGEPPCEPICTPAYRIGGGKMEGGSGDDWYMEPIILLKQDVRMAFEDHCRRNGIRSAGASGRAQEMLFAAEMKKVIPALEDKRVKVPEHRYDVSTHGDGRAWAYSIPPLEECRRAMEGLLGGPGPWSKGV